MKTGFSTDMVY